MIHHTIIHIPHASTQIPNDLRKEFMITGDEIENELRKMVDWYTDELFFYDGITMHKNDLARIVFDPERFRYRDDEYMEHVGMGAIYEKTCDGRTMRSPNEVRREELLQRFYDPYHTG